MHSRVILFLNWRANFNVSNINGEIYKYFYMYLCRYTYCLIMSAGHLLTSK